MAFFNDHHPHHTINEGIISQKSVDNHPIIHLLWSACRSHLNTLNYPSTKKSTKSKILIFKYKKYINHLDFNIAWLQVSFTFIHWPNVSREKKKKPKGRRKKKTQETLVLNSRWQMSYVTVRERKNPMIPRRNNFPFFFFFQRYKSENNDEMEWIKWNFIVHLIFFIILVDSFRKNFYLKEWILKTKRIRQRRQVKW